MASRFRGAGRLRKPRGVTDSPDSKWFWDHYEWAAGEIIKFSSECGLRLGDLELADIGCGDGIMALGLCAKAKPRRLVGFDLVPTGGEWLLSRARAQGITLDALPAELEFHGSESTRIPAADASFDFVYSWSAFEHISDPLGVLSEIRRILRPDGHFFLQLWPFYHSAKGSHLWEWFPEDYHHLTTNERDIVTAMLESERTSPDMTSYMIREFEHLNRVTLDELQRAVLGAGFDVRKLELLTSPAILTPELGRYSWADLATGGIKLLATPRLR